MIERKTIIDQIEVTRTGHVDVRFGLLLIENDTEIDCKWHRTVIVPGLDVDAQLAFVNAHLESMGKPAVDTARIQQLKDVVALVHTPDVIAAYQAVTASRELVG